jgi:hypothetical protein
MQCIRCIDNRAATGQLWVNLSILASEDYKHMIGDVCVVRDSLLYISSGLQEFQSAGLVTSALGLQASRLANACEPVPASHR